MSEVARRAYQVRRMEESKEEGYVPVGVVVPVSALAILQREAELSGCGFDAVMTSAVALIAYGLAYDRPLAFFDAEWGGRCDSV